MAPDGDWPNYSTHTRQYSVALVLPHVRPDFPDIHWTLQIGEPFHATVRRKFTGLRWDRARSTWVIPFVEPWTDLAQIGKALDECVQNPAPPPPSVPSHGRHAYSWTHPPSHLPEFAPPREPAKRPRSPEPDVRGNAKRARTDPVTAPAAAHDPDEVVMVDMQYEPRTITDTCKTYCAHRFYEVTDTDTVVALRVDECTFKEGVLCVCISGKVDEVEAYYHTRFIVEHAGTHHRDMHHFENKTRNFAARVVAEFIL